MDTNVAVVVSSQIIAALLTLAGLYYKDRADQRRITGQNVKIDRNADKVDEATARAQTAYEAANHTNEKIAEVAEVKSTVEAVHDRLVSIESRINGTTHGAGRGDVGA